MKLNPQKTALLTLDYQKGIFGMVEGSEHIIPNAAKVVEFSRIKHFKVIHVGLGFEQGHPEIPSTNAIFKRVKENNLFVKGTPSVEFHSSILEENDLIIYKHRVSGFSSNNLYMILRAQGIEHLVLMGIATSGIVLSTLRQAFDLDFQCTVIKDACFDRDEEVHRVLTEKVFTNQATVLTSDEFIAQQS